MKKKPANVEEAIRMFDQKVHDKTVKGHYIEIKMEEDPKETIGKSEISRGKFDKKLAEEREKKKISPVLIIEKEQTKKKSKGLFKEKEILILKKKVLKQLTCILMKKTVRFIQEMMGKFIQKN